MYKEDYCGIYKIENLVNGKVYIGQSRCIFNRWRQHKQELNKGKHNNGHLQNAWNKYGKSNFDFSIIKLCDLEELNEYEILYISLFSSYNEKYGYNLTKGGYTNALISPESKERQKKALSGINNTHRKEVTFLEGHKIFYSISDAAKYLGIKNTALISKCCQGLIPSVKGLHFVYFEDLLTMTEKEAYDRLSKTSKGKTRQIIYLNTNEIFNSIKEASEKTKTPKHSINQCCLHNRKTAGKDQNNNPRYFMYYDEYLQKQSEESVI